MPLQEQIVDISLTGGMATKVSKEGSDPGASQREVSGYRYGELGRLERLGKYSLRNHPNSGLGTDWPSAATSVRTLATRNGEVFGVSDEGGIVRVPRTDSTGDARLCYARNSTTEPSYLPIHANVKKRVGLTQGAFGRGFVSAAVAAIDSDTLVCAWAEESSTGSIVHMMAIDPVTGEMASDRSHAIDTNQASYEQTIHVERISATSAVVTWMVFGGSAYEIVARTYDASTGLFSSSTTLSTDVKTPYYGVRPSNNERFLLGFTEFSSGNIRVQSRSLSTLDYNTSTGSYGADDGIDMYYVGSGAVSTNTFVCSINGASMRMAKLNSLGSTQTTLSSMVRPGSSYTQVTICPHNGPGTTPMLVVAEIDSDMIQHLNAQDSSGGFTDRGYQYYCRLASKAFQIGDNGYYFAHLSADGPLTSVALVRGFTGQGSPLGINDIGSQCAVARIFHDVATQKHQDTFGANYGERYAISCAVIGDSVYLAHTTGSNDPTDYYGRAVQIGGVDFLDAAQPMPYLEDRGTTLVTGGMPWVYDGVRGYPAAPLRRPGPPGITKTSGSITGSISFLTVYKWVDSRGLEHRSAPSEAVSVTFSSEGYDVTVQEMPFHMLLISDDERASAEMEIYATEVGGSVFYKLYIGAPGVPDGNGGVTYSSTIASTDTPLYTGGGELPSDPAPPLSSIARIQDRIVGLDAELPSRVHFSKPLVEGRAPEWSALNTVNIGDEGVAVFEHGGEIGVLCKNGVWKVSGQGPNANGQGVFAPPYRLPVQVSAVSPQSVVSTPMGTFFQADNGIMLIGLDGSVQFPGVSIADMTTANRAEVQRASYWDDANEVRFLVYDLHEDVYRVYIYSLTAGGWTVEHCTDDAGSIERYDECFAKYYGFASNTDDYDIEGFAGYELQGLETTSDYNSNTGECVIDTHYFKPDGLTSGGRVWRVDVAFRCDDDASTTAIDASLYDLRDGESGTKIADFSVASGDLDWAEGTIQWISLYPGRQNVSGLRLRVVVDDAVTPRKGIVPISMRIKYGVEPNYARRSAETKGPAI